MEHDDNPKLRPNAQQKMPNRVQLKRSLLPDNTELILSPSLRIQFPDKTRLKKQEFTLSASFGRVVSWVPTSNGVRLTAAAVLAMFCFDFSMTDAPPNKPKADILHPSAQPHFPINEVLEPLILASHPFEIPTHLTFKKSVTPSSIWSDLPTRSPLTFMVPQPPICPERTTTATLLAPSSLALEKAIIPTQSIDLSTNGEMLLAFLEDQPIGGAVRAVKALPRQIGVWAERGKEKAQFLTRQLETRRTHLQNEFTSRKNRVIELQEQLQMKWMGFWKKNQNPVTKMQDDASTAQTSKK